MSLSEQMGLPLPSAAGLDFRVSVGTLKRSRFLALKLLQKEIARHCPPGGGCYNMNRGDLWGNLLDREPLDLSRSDSGRLWATLVLTAALRGRVQWRGLAWDLNLNTFA